MPPVPDPEGELAYDTPAPGRRLALGRSIAPRPDAVVSGTELPFGEVPVRRSVVVSLALTVSLMGGLLSATTAAQLHQDTRYGFKFKPPKDFKAVALKPGEMIIIAKYQDPQKEYGGEQGYSSHSRTFTLTYWPHFLADAASPCRW